jgi:DNA repair exonuclease SbcCD ATPase subunit
MATPTLKLTSLNLRSFRSFVDEQQLDLPDSGLHLIEAPSGSGKSGLVEAIAYALDYSQWPATEHQSWGWLTDQPMEVRLDFEVKGEKAKIVRGKRPLLSVGDVSLTSASTIAKKLPEVLGCRPEVLRALTYRPQRQTGLFLSFSDSEKKSFLTELLRMGDVEREIEVLGKTLTELDKKLAVSKAKLDQARSALPLSPPTEPKPADVGGLQLRVSSALKLIGGLTVEVSTVRTNILSLEEQRKDRLVECEKLLLPAITEAQVKLEAAKLTSFEADPAVAQMAGVIKKRIAYIQSGMSKLKEQHLSNVKSAQTQLESIRKEVWKANTIIKGLPTLQQQMAVLVNDIQAIETAICSTCRQTWVGLDAERTLADKNRKLEVLEKQVADAESQKEAVEALLAEQKGQEDLLKALMEEDPIPEKFKVGEADQQRLLMELEQTQKSEQREFEVTKKANLAVLEAELQAAKTSRQMHLAKLSVQTEEEAAAAKALVDKRAELQTANSEHSAALAELSSVQRLDEQAAKSYDASLMSYLKLSAAVDIASDEVGAVKVSYGWNEDAHQLLKQFLGLVFDETLQLIAARATELLFGIPNVQGMTIGFLSERETKSGSVKQEIKPVISKDGHQVSFRSGCSGGQQAVIELAVDLSLAEVISERTGILPGWLVLDEPFDGLGAADKEAAMAVLARSAADRAIYVIDHSAEVKESFDSVLTIIHQDNRSHIKSESLR